MATVNSTTSTTSNSTSSSTAFSYLQYKNKISGLVSGMDVESIMEKLMKAESAQMEKLQQQQQKYEWQRDAYRDVNLKLDTFQNGIFDDYGLKSDWNMKNVSVSNSDVSAVATSAANGTLNITEAKMATAGQKIVTTMGSNASADSTLLSVGITTDGSFDIQAINEKGEYTTKTIAYKTTDKVSDIMSRINSSGVGVTAIVSNNSLSLNANIDGTVKDVNGVVTGAIRISSDTNANGVFKALGVLSANTGNVTTGTGATEGNTGYIVANGVKIEGTSNNYTVSGYQLTINKNINVDSSGNSITGASATAGTKISSTTNTDDIVKKVKAFVDKYNGLITDLNQRVTEKKQTDYQPLTDAQKAGMTTDQITKWETNAKAGLLKGDTTLNTVLSNMRQTIATYGSSTNGTGNNSDMLFKIGVSTTQTWSDGGKLEVDEDKLKKALQDDPDIVSRIFTGDTATGTEGVISKLRTTAKNAVSTIKNTAGSEGSSDSTYSLGKTIADYTTKINDWKDRLKGIEERYWNQFSAMEQAIQKANSQSSIFSQG